jgi:anti-sigma regulatory factor (Ser/Thr protein kinase)
VATEELRVSIRPDQGAPAEARRSLERLADRVPRPTLDDARLLVSELVTNAVRGGGLVESGAIEVVIRSDGSRLSVDVSDRGTWPVTEDASLVPPAGTGWGLLLLDRLAEAWGADISAGGIRTVWFRMSCGDG